MIPQPLSVYSQYALLVCRLREMVDTGNENSEEADAVSQEALGLVEQMTEEETVRAALLLQSLVMGSEVA